MTFGNSVLGAAGTLVRKAVRSKNYVVGTSGWILDQGGSAEFNGAVIARSFHTGNPWDDDVRVTLRDASGGDVEFFLQDDTTLAGRMRLFTSQVAIDSFPSVRSSASTIISSNTTTFTVNEPPTVEATDQIVYVINADAGSGRTITPPAGVTTRGKWTSGFTKTTELFTADSVDGTEDGGTLNFTLNASAEGVCFAFAISSMLSNSSIQAVGTEVVNTGTSSPDPPNFTPTGGSKKWLWLAHFGGRDDDALVTAFPANYTHHTIQGRTGNGINASMTAGCAFRQLEAASENPGAFTLDDPEYIGAVTIAIEPAAAGTVDQIILAVEADDRHPTHGRPRLFIIQGDTADVDASVEIGIESNALVRCSEVDGIQLNGASKVTTDSLTSSATAGTPVHHNATTNELFRYTGP